MPNARVWRALLAAAALIVATIGLSPHAAAAAEGAETSVERYEFQWDPFVEQSPPCTAEGILWSGGYQTTITTTRTPGGATIRSLNYQQTMTGVGVLSGSSYQLHAHYHEQVRRGSDGADVLVFPLTYVQTSSDGGSNYLAHSVRVAVVNAQGVPVLAEPLGEHFFVRCLG
jgi:hypothetical protein